MKINENKISACLVIYNEEKVLDRCLQSIKNVVDEIIIVHDGPCGDKSLIIAKKYNAKIFVQPFVGEAERHRPFSFKKASGDWILHIDADEFLPVETQKEIRKLVSVGGADAYSFRWPLWNNHKSEYFQKGPFSKTQRLCLFRKDKMYMVGITHFHPKTRGKIVHRRDLVVEHKHSYFKFDFSIYKTKIIKWAKLEALQTINYKNAPVYNISSREVVDIYTPILKFHVYYGLKLVIRQFLHYVKNGLLFSNFLTWKVAILDLTRVLITHYYIYEYNKNKKSFN